MIGIFIQQVFSHWKSNLKRSDFMESFYGGRPGYPFILKGEFNSQNEIETAANNNELSYGDYAIVAGENAETQYRGKIYRVIANKKLLEIGRITSPSVSTYIDAAGNEIFDENSGAGVQNFKVVAPDNDNTNSKMFFQRISNNDSNGTDTLKIGFSEPYTLIKPHTFISCNCTVAPVWTYPIEIDDQRWLETIQARDFSSSFVQITPFPQQGEDTVGHPYIKHLYFEQSPPIVFQRADDENEFSINWVTYPVIQCVLEDV